MPMIASQSREQRDLGSRQARHGGFEGDCSDWVLLLLFIVGSMLKATGRGETGAHWWKGRPGWKRLGRPFYLAEIFRRLFHPTYTPIACTLYANVGINGLICQTYNSIAYRAS